MKSLSEKVAIVTGGSSKDKEGIAVDMGLQRLVPCCPEPNGMFAIRHRL